MAIAIARVFNGTPATAVSRIAVARHAKAQQRPVEQLLDLGDAAVVHRRSSRGGAWRSCREGLGGSGGGTPHHTNKYRLVRCGMVLLGVAGVAAIAAGVLEIILGV